LKDKNGQNMNMELIICNYPSGLANLVCASGGPARWDGHDVGVGTG